MVWRQGFRVHAFGCFLLVWHNRPLLFSERYNYRRVHRLGAWSIECGIAR
jgi:hypothetical protein